MIKRLYFTLMMLLLLSACGNSSPADRGYQPSGGILAPRLLSSTDHAGGQGWRRTDCFVCHPTTKLKDTHSRVPRIWDTLSRLGDSANRACLACHDTNGLTPEEGGVRECLICHGNNAVIGGAAIFSKEKMHTVTGGSSLRDADCVVCHERSDMDGVFDISKDLTNFGVNYQGINDFCLACHDINGAAGILPPPLRFDTEFTDIYRTFMGVGLTEDYRKATADIHGFKDGRDHSARLFGVFRNGYTNRMVLNCTECHYVHSSSNPYLITELGSSASRLNAGDPARKATVKVTQRRFNQLCAVCHTNPDGPDAGNGLLEPVHFGFTVTDCVDCHYHGAGYGISKNNLF